MQNRLTMAAEIEELLASLHDGERLLGELAAVDPDHESVRIAVALLREQRASLHATTEESVRALAASRDSIEAARDIIRQTQGSLNRHRT